MSTPTERWEATMVPNYGTPGLHLTEGKGSWVTASDGQTYLDLLAGLAVNVLGHAHPSIVEAVCTQVSTLGHTSNLYSNEPSLMLSERLSNRAGGKQAALVNSGSEANELALKMVRRHAHAQDRGDGLVLAFEQSFHGRTLGSLALTGQPGKHVGFDPLPGKIGYVPYNDPAALEHAFDVHDVVGVFAEVVQGEGGIIPMEPSMARVLGRLCAEHDAVLVVDEVQTGVGRTGSFFAYEQVGLDPDIVTMAKAIGGGLPIGACLADPAIAQLMGPGSHGCTFGGNPVACAAANAVLDVYEGQALDKRAATLGQAASEILEGAVDGAQPRGMGALLGLPLGSAVASEAVHGAQNEGVLVGQAGEDVVRIAPALTIGETELVEGLEAVLGAVDAACS